MPCYYPRQGWRSKKINESGKRSIVFKPQDAFVDMPITIPCGQCIGCRLEKSRQWAIRISHEASLYEKNCFITLTYNNENLPENGTLVKKHFTLFMKRLRKKYKNKKIRYFMCGEYGDELGRPHYHAILFNHDFDDKEYHSGTKKGDILYKSNELNELWSISKKENSERTGETRGFCTIGTVTFESAGYVARYCTKKINGAGKADHYQQINEGTGEITSKVPEYAQMSRKPAIAKDWFDKFYLDIYRHDVMNVRCREMRPPKYYDEQFEKIDPKRMAVLKKIRKDKGIDNPENDYYRLLTKCELKHIKAGKLIRSYENEQN